MTSGYSVLAVIAVSVATIVIGAFGLRLSRTTSDFYVASRSVSPMLNSSAISGEYLSAASFLGVAGLILTQGASVLWYPIGWTAGYLLLLIFVAAPLRRSGAYTIPDFAQMRLQTLTVRRLATVLVIAIGWLYLLPQFQGAGLTLRVVVNVPAWVGTLVVAVIVTINVISGGMRSITFVQAFQYWLKLTALGVPLVFLLIAWNSDGRPAVATGDMWGTVLSEGSAQDLYIMYAVIIATVLGTMGLPHVVVRFYTNPDGRTARRTTVIVLGLLGIFYILPVTYGLLGRIYASDLAGTSEADTVLLALPARVLSGNVADILTALLTAGAFAAFLSTSSGVTMAVAGVMGQAITQRGPLKGKLTPVSALRVSSVVCVVVPLVLALAAEPTPVATSVVFAFALAASTFCPLLVLGIWWRGLTSKGAIAGLTVGGLTAGSAPLLTLIAAPEGWLGTLAAHPALWTVPLSFITMVGVSLATRSSVPPSVTRTMVRLHTPEDSALARDVN